MPATAPAAFPWAEVLHAGLHSLRLSPQAFWALSPREFHIMAGGLRMRQGVPGRTDLAALMASFPDAAG